MFDVMTWLYGRLAWLADWPAGLLGFLVGATRLLPNGRFSCIKKFGSVGWVAGWLADLLADWLDGCAS